MKNSNGTLSFILLALLAFGIQDNVAPIQSWDLAVNRDYATRTAKQLSTLSLEDAKITFLDNDTLAIIYADGGGASSSGGLITALNSNKADYSSAAHLEQFAINDKAALPLYKFHALVFNWNTGPHAARELAWDAIREKPQFLPMQNGGFVVRVDNHVMVYSPDLKVQKEMNLEYYGDRPLPTGEPFFQEYYSIGVSLNSQSLAVCHSLLGRHNSGGVQVTWYDLPSLKITGQVPNLSRAPGIGCGYGLTTSDNSIHFGHYIVHRDATIGHVNPLCINCNGVPALSDKMYSHYDLLDAKHLLIYDKDVRVIDFDGHETYMTSHENGVRVDKPNSDDPMPHAANAPRIAYDDGQPKDERGHGISKRIHVVDWENGSKLATIKITQDHSPVLHGGGLQLERGNLMDFDYALSPNGKRLAVLSLNSVKIYDLP